jgi:hypothetical protein
LALAIHWQVPFIGKCHSLASAIHWQLIFVISGISGFSGFSYTFVFHSVVSHFSTC